MSEMSLQSNLNVIMIIESNIRALVFIEFIKLVAQKEIKCLTILAFYLFSLTSFINSIKHEHSCKILYLYNCDKYWAHMFELMDKKK